jgi:formate dehydrogenase maturation protein FdhE
MTQPQSMVERVAKAMHAAYEAAAKVNGWATNEQCRVAFDDLPAENKATMYASARAAIEAMREPSEAMIATADDVYDQCTDTGDFYGFIWRAMIDAALAEQSPAENGPVRGEGA